MPRVRMIIEDDDGRPIATREVELDIKSGSFHDVEGAVEDFRKEELPRLERDLLRRAQDRLKEEKGGC